MKEEILAHIEDAKAAEAAEAHVRANRQNSRIKANGMSLPRGGG